ncbi:MAG: hypothetical protein LKJ76_03870 [Lachnospiraceae bacterium]|jgi:hypothetical protein|nr:hypothetical protein [Lachnospiraceae bacterium]
MSNLYCGTAKRCITPDKEMIPHLSGLMEQDIGGVLDDLYVRVLFLRHDVERMMFIVFDLDKAPQPIRYLKALKETYHLEEEEVFITAVHTHCAPISGDRTYEGPNNIDLKAADIQEATHKYEDFLLIRMMEACQEAYIRQAPCRMGIGSCNSYINVDGRQWYEYRDEIGKIHRRLEEGSDFSRPITHKATVIKFTDTDDRILCIFVHYPCHCTIMHTNKCINGKMGISADLAGKVCTNLETEYPGSTAIWCTGAAGNIYPIYANELHYPDLHTGDMVTQRMNGESSRMVLEALAANHSQDIIRTVQKINCSITNAYINGIVAWSRTPGVEGEYEVRLHMMTLGKTILIGGSGEFYSAYADLASEILPDSDVILIDHDCCMISNTGYIYDDETLLMPEADLPGLQRTNMLPGYFGKSFVDHLITMHKELMEEMDEQMY